MSVPVEAFILPGQPVGTLQQQVRRLVVDGILSGRFRVGDRLPSTRALARHLGISRITVTFAYTDLVADDYLTSRGRSGYYVSHSLQPRPELARPSTGAATQRNWSALIRRKAPQTARIERPTDWQRYPYPFIYGQPDPALFDHASWRRCALQALGQREFDALTSDHYERDDAQLVDYLVHRLLPRRGIRADQSQVLLTLGSQNALWLTAHLLLTPECSAVMETPGYQGLREILAHTQCRTIAAPVDAHGLQPSAVPAGVDAVYVTPGRQSPTGAVMTKDRRQDLIARASRDGFVIVEDEYEQDIDPEEGALPALKAIDTEGSVIYVGSFSKSLFPGLRLGYLVAPEPFIREARALRGAMLRHPPGTLQGTVARFLALGSFDAQMKRIRLAYRARRAAMDAAIAAYGLTPADPAIRGGSSLWMRAPGDMDTSTLALRLRSKGVLIEPGAAFFDPAMPNTHHYRIAYSSIPETRIRSGVGLIAEEIATMQAEAPAAMIKR